MYKKFYQLSKKSQMFWPKLFLLCGASGLRWSWYGFLIHKKSPYLILFQAQTTGWLRLTSLLRAFRKSVWLKIGGDILTTMPFRVTGPNSSGEKGATARNTNQQAVRPLNLGPISPLISISCRQAKDWDESSGQFRFNISGALQIDRLLPDDAEALFALSASSLSSKPTDPSEDLPSETEERGQVAKEDTGLGVHLRIM